MFFTGAISSLFPYLATIALMVTYLFIGNPTNTLQNTSSSGSQNNITYTQQTDNNLTACQSTTYNYTVDYSMVARYEFATSSHPPKPCYNYSHYRFLALLSSPNKAPPYYL